MTFYFGGSATDLYSQVGVRGGVSRGVRHLHACMKTRDVDWPLHGDFTYSWSLPRKPRFRFLRFRMRLDASKTRARAERKSGAIGPGLEVFGVPTQHACFTEPPCPYPIHQKCLGWTNINGDRSPQCKPLGGQSSWASVGDAGEGERETVFAVAGMDSTAMFHDRAPGEAYCSLCVFESLEIGLARAGRTFWLSPLAPRLRLAVSQHWSKE